MRSTSAILLLSCAVILFSCDLFDNKYCSETARKLTAKELSFMNFNVDDSIVYGSDANQVYYIKCTGKDHEFVDTVRASSGCEKNEFHFHYDKLDARFKANIPTKKGDVIKNINIEIKTRTGSDESLGTMTLGDITSASIFYFGTTSNSSVPVPMDSSERQYNRSINYHLDKYNIGGRSFNDVTVFCQFPDLAMLSPYSIDTLYYQPDNGILKLVVDGKPFVFKNRY